MKGLKWQFIDAYDVKSILQLLPIDDIFCETKKLCPKQRKFLNYWNINRFYKILGTLNLEILEILKRHFFHVNTFTKNPMNNLTKMIDI